MGYLNPAKSTPGDAIAWNKEENAYNHPWALERRLFNYGYYKLGEIFHDVNEYLSTPADLVELIANKVNEGIERRSEDDKRARGNKKNDFDLSNDELRKFLS